MKLINTVSVVKNIICSFLLISVSFVSLASQPITPQPDPVEELSPGVLYGFLPWTSLPDSLNLVGKPPKSDSSELAFDQERNKEMLLLKGSKRWEIAVSDSNLKFPHAAGTFSCALGFDITEHDYPNLYMLLRRSATDAGLSTFAAKKKYQRSRPFMVNEQPTCDPSKEDHLRTSGAYPSGHSAIGWAWALILSELVPDKSNSILARGRAFAQSRAVCNVHWQSDIVNGSVLGAAAYSKLHSSELFLTTLKRAKAEIKQNKGKDKTKDLPSLEVCKNEAEALAIFY